MTDATPDDRRVAIVTGAAGALGSAMCERFVRDGVRAVVADVAIEPARALAEPRRCPGDDRNATVEAESAQRVGHRHAHTSSSSTAAPVA